MPRVISLAALTVLELTPPEMVACAAAAGYSHVGLRLLPATPEEVDHGLVGHTPMVRETLARLADAGIAVLDAEIFRLRPETRVKDYLSAMETAARLGARYLLVAGNDPDEARLTDRFGAFCDLAERFGLACVLEFMPWTDARDLTQAARIVGGAARPNGGVLIDAFHFDRSGSRLEDLAALPPPWLPYAQLCDVPAKQPADMTGIIAEARSERLFPGEGEVDLEGLLRALPPGIPLSLEVPTHRLARTMGALDRARRGLAATRSLLAEIDPHEGAAA
jgi:sugar phosphate isomerase/epimerase